jgi:hypothetical protein
LKEFEDSASSSTDKTNKKKSDQVGIIQKLNAELSKYKTLITKATSEAEIAKYNAKLQETQKELARLNALGKVFEQRKVLVKEEIGLIGQLNAQVKQLKVSLRQATSEQEVARLNAQLEQTSAELARINSLGKTVTAPAVRSFDNLKRAQGAASSAAISFGRIIQDAPFGIIGVANNIQNFGEQFVALGGKSATAGQKLSQFFSALITPSNLAILAVSALTAAYQAYALGLFDTAEETKEVVSETDRFNEALNNVIKSLNDVDSARLKANKSAASESAEVQLLNSVLTDNSKSENERIIVYNKLLEKYPKIIGNITKEKAITEGLGDAYNVLIASIKERAAIDAISESFSDAQKERIDLIVKERKETLLQNKLYEERDKLRKEEIDLSAIVNRNTARGNTQETEVTKKLREKRAAIASVNEQISILGNVAMPATEAALVENSGTLTILNEQYGVLNQELADLSDGKPEESINRTRESLSKLNDSLTILSKVRENFFGESLAAFFSRDLESADIAGPVQGASQIYTENLEAIRQQLTLFEESLNQVGLTSAQVFQSIALGSAQGFNSLNEFILKLSESQQFLNEATSILEQGIENTLGDVAFAIGKALGEGGNALQAGGAALLGGIASTLNQLGQMAIATGVTLKAIKTALETLNPVVAIAAGVALVGLAGFVSSQANKLSGNFGGGGSAPSAGSGSTFTNRREFGGPVSKGRAYIVGERRPELFVPNTNGIIVPQVPSMDYSSTSVSSGMYGVEVMLKGPDDLLFFVEQAQVRRNIR